MILVLQYASLVVMWWFSITTLGHQPGVILKLMIFVFFLFFSSYYIIYCLIGCRHLTYQLMKIQIVNDVNKVFTWPWKNVFSRFFFQLYDLLLCHHEGFCYWSSEVNCGVDNIWWPAWLSLFWVRPFDSLCFWMSLFWRQICNKYFSFWSPCRFFMEKQVMGEFVRILKVSRSVTVSLQLLQTMSIMIQNLKSEHAICKMILMEVIMIFYNLISLALLFFFGFSISS